MLKYLVLFLVLIPSTSFAEDAALDRVVSDSFTKVIEPSLNAYKFELCKSLQGGKVVVYNANGIKIYERKSSEGCRYEDLQSRKVTGVVSIFDKNGTIFQLVEYKDGLRDGISYDFRDGKKSGYAEYKDGRLEGKIINYNLDGSIKSSTRIKNSMFDGEQLEYEKGKITAFSNYRQGILHGQTFSINKADRDAPPCCSDYEDGIRKNFGCGDFCYNYLPNNS